MSEPDVALFAPEAAGAGSAVIREASVDVLILTALQDELEAVLDLGAGWEERKDQQGFRCYRRGVDNGRGGVLQIAAAWSGEMGDRTAAMRAQQLVEELHPGCLAMCGICAGYREKVSLGDVIMADQLYGYDEGKIIAGPEATQEMLHSIRTFDLQATWKMDAAYLARELDLSLLGSARPPSKEAQRRWLLGALLAHENEGGPAPAIHPDRKRDCPGWTQRLKVAAKDGLVAMKGGSLRLTEAGREHAEEDRLLHPDGPPADPPLRIHVGAIGTGRTVQENPSLFERLRRVVRTTLGVDMEGVAIGDVAARYGKRAIVIKAVSDHADHDKDDSFRAFACRASAEVLLAFLRRHVDVEPHAPHAGTGEQEAGGKDATVRGLRKVLEVVHARKQRLAARGLSTQETDREILGLRRELRAGGQLHEGDALGNGRYLLVRRIGKGGFAMVWEALDTSCDERVALKVLHPELARDATRLERFFRGAREMAELKHEAVVRVFEQYGEDDGWHYFVMELVSGGDLRKAVLEKRVSAEDVLGIIERVGDALAAAHAKGLVHRDVKPANILLDAAGGPRLTDFDLVAAADTTGGTRTGAMGTFIYAAPEMLDRPQDADERADVYGLGMTAVFALYAKDLPMTMMRYGEQVIQALPCDAGVKGTLKKAIAWRKEDRFQSVEAFCGALREAEARSGTGLAKARGMVLERLQTGGAAPLMPGELRPIWTTASKCHAVAWSPSGAIIASGHWNGTVVLWDVASGKAIRVIASHRRPVRSVAFSPDGLTLASGSDDKTVRLWDVTITRARASRTFNGHKSGVNSVAFSPDGLTLASGSDDRTVRLWNVATARALHTCQEHTKEVWSVAFSPDGLTLASGSHDTTVRLWDVATSRILGACEGNNSWVWSVAFSPDGGTLASGSAGTTIRLWDVATARALRSCQGPTGLSVAFSPDGLTLASGSNDTTVRLWDVAAARTLRAFEGHEGSVMSVAFSPDGLTLASASSDGTLRLWDVATARCLAALLSLREGWAAFTPDGRYKLGGDIAGSFWHVIGLCRFEPGELDPYLPHLRIPDDEPLLALPGG